MSVAILAGCADFERGGDSPATGPTASDAAGDGGQALTYAASVHPLLVSGCQSCHRSGGAAASTALVFSGDASSDFSAAASLVDTSNPALSRLLRKAAGAGHGGGAIFREASPEYHTVFAWISGGARP